MLAAGPTEQPTHDARDQQQDPRCQRRETPFLEAGCCALGKRGLEDVGHCTFIPNLVRQAGHQTGGDPQHPTSEQDSESEESERCASTTSQYKGENGSHAGRDRKCRPQVGGSFCPLPEIKRVCATDIYQSSLGFRYIDSELTAKFGSHQAYERCNVEGEHRGTTGVTI